MASVTLAGFDGDIGLFKILTSVGSVTIPIRSRDDATFEQREIEGLSVLSLMLSEGAEAVQERFKNRTKARRLPTPKRPKI